MLLPALKISTKGEMNARRKKMLLFAIADSALLTAGVVLAFLLRFDGIIPPIYQKNLVFYSGLAILFTIPLLAWRRLYSFTWKFVSLNEIVELFKVFILSAGLFTLSYVFFQYRGGENLFTSFPRSIIILEYFLAFLFLGGLRISKRIIFILFNKKQNGNEKKQTLIIGADEKADELIRILQKTKNNYHVFGILDDDPEKQGTLLHGVKVLGKTKNITSIINTHGVETIIIALAQDNGKTIAHVVEQARNARITDIKIIPSMYEALDGKIGLETLRSVRVEDLLGRKPAKIETHEIEKFVNDKNILITGAGGTIGGELARQISRFSPGNLFLLDHEESNLFDIARILALEHPALSLRSLVCDIRNRVKIETLIMSLKPHIIFHAAAYKHVPLMEEFPEEAISTNIFGTYWVAKSAIKAGVEKFILISSDKAVRPLSIMGRTKKVAEMIVSTLNTRNVTQFISVRFGNVLGSRGSVVPIFEEQIRRRQPVTVTHPKMTRFFMTTPEAVLLVLEAAATGQGGEMFILDMGKPVRIQDLAREVIRLSGLRPDKDIPIVYTSPRPGEKISETVLTQEEGVSATRYQKIFRAKTSHNLTPGELLVELKKLKECFDDREKLKETLAKLTS